MISRFCTARLCVAACPAFGEGIKLEDDGIVVVIPRSDGKGYVLEAAIPLLLVSLKKDVQARIRFDIAVDDDETGNGRTRQLVWNGNARNSTDRSAWGHATFLP